MIEDCVHSLGAKYAGRPLGSFGKVAFFSTEETKTISSTMGGMVVTDDPDLAREIAAFQAACRWPKRSLTWRYVLKLVLYHMLPFGQPPGQILEEVRSTYDGDVIEAVDLMRL